MKIILVFSALFAFANAGGKTLSAAESAQHLSKFNLVCRSGGGQNQDGNTMYYCKTAEEPITVKVDHEQELNGGETPKQVIYIQPPPQVYKHNIGISGSPGSPQQTDIYVLPQKATHELTVSDQRSQTQANKPQLYFLTGSAEESTGTGGERRPSNAPPPPPGYQHGGPSGQSDPAPSYLPPRPSNYVQPYARAQRNVVTNNNNYNYPQHRSY